MRKSNQDLSNYLVVYHYWFMDSGYFKESFFYQTTYDEVLKEAAVIKLQTESTFNRCAFHIVKLESTTLEAVLIA